MVHEKPPQARGWCLALGLFAAAITPCAVARAQENPVATAEKRLPGKIFLAVLDVTNVLHGLLAVDPNDRTCATLFEEGNFSMRLAPGGRMVAFARNDRRTRKTTVCVLDLDQNQEPVPVFDRNAWPCWSGDGKHLLVSLLDEKVDVKEPRTWRMNADGTGRESLRLPATEQVWDWSADGQWVVTSSARSPNEEAGVLPLLYRPLYVMRIDGTDARLIAPAGSVHVKGVGRSSSVSSTYKPRFSPDGTSLLLIKFSIVEYGDEPRIDHDVKVWSLDRNSETRRIVYDGNETSGIPTCAAWSPDRKTLAVILANKRIVANVRESWESRLWLVDADGKNPREVQLPPLSMVTILDWR